MHSYSRQAATLWGTLIGLAAHVGALTTVVQHFKDGGMKPQLAHWDGFKEYDLRNGVGEIRRFCLEDADGFFTGGATATGGMGEGLPQRGAGYHAGGAGYVPGEQAHPHLGGVLSLRL